MADKDVVEQIAQYDLDDDFPDYANEQNKELNQIVGGRRWRERFLTAVAGAGKSEAGSSAGAGNRGASGTAEDSRRAPEKRPNGTDSYSVAGKNPRR